MKGSGDESPAAPHLQRGRWGEKLAAEHLIAQGYAVMETNWRMGRYEIDIVAQKGKDIVFVEVKTRTSPEADPVDAVNRAKRAKMVASANAYIQHYDIPYEYRFDIIAVTGTPQSYAIEHIPDAFYPPLSSGFARSFRP